MKTEYLTTGRRLIKIIEKDDGSWSASCLCNATDATVEIPLTASEASELLSGPQQRVIQDVLPNTPSPLREIFVSGMTPAEFDRDVRGELRSKEFYETLGYDFENGESHDQSFEIEM